MASLGPINYVVVVPPLGGSKASDIKLVLQREPRIGKARLRVGSILPKEAHVDVAIRNLFEETGLTLTSQRAYLVEWQLCTWNVTHHCRAPARSHFSGIGTCSVRDC
jgi:8-oxo-dGTP pyrophosphatase MutT (NUDIX family)